MQKPQEEEGYRHRKFVDRKKIWSCAAGLPFFFSMRRKMEIDVVAGNFEIRNNIILYFGAWAGIFMGFFFFLNRVIKKIYIYRAD